MKEPGVKYGLIGAGVVILYFLLFYLAKKPLFIHPVVQWASMAIYLTCMVQAAREDCAAKGYNRDFRAILRTPFVVFLLINFGYWLFYYSLHLADSELLNLETQANLAYYREQLQNGPGDPEQANKIRDQIQYLEKEGMGMALGPILLQMCMGALGGFGLSAGIAAWLRSRVTA